MAYEFTYDNEFIFAEWCEEVDGNYIPLGATLKIPLLRTTKTDSSNYWTLDDASLKDKLIAAGAIPYSIMFSEYITKDSHNVLAFGSNGANAGWGQNSNGVYYGLKNINSGGRNNWLGYSTQNNKENMDCILIYSKYTGYIHCATLLTDTNKVRMLPYSSYGDTNQGILLDGYINPEVTVSEIKVSCPNYITKGKTADAVAKVYGEGAQIAEFRAEISGNTSPNTKVITKPNSIYFTVFVDWEETAEEINLIITSTQNPNKTVSKLIKVRDKGGSGGGTELNNQQFLMGVAIGMRIKDRRGEDFVLP